MPSSNSTATIRAILLVCQPEHSEPVLSFAWPPSPSPSSSSNLTTYLNFEPDDWAQILTPARLASHPRPPSAPSADKLELLIDALAIIAHPVLISHKPLLPLNHGPIERGRTRTRSGDKDLAGSLDQPDLIPSSSPAASSQPTRPASLFLAAPSLPLPRSPSRPPPVSQLTRMMTRANIAPLDGPPNPPPASLPSSLSPLPQRHSTYSPLLPPPSSPPPAPQNIIPLQSFTLALVLDAPATQLALHLDLYHRDVVLKLTAALKLLERQNQYLTREAHKIASVQARRDEEASRSASQPKRTGTAEMMALIIQTSELARTLAGVFDALKRNGRASATLGHLPLDLLLHDELLCPDPTGGPAYAELEPETDPKDRFAHVEAWKCLLLLEEPETLIAHTAPQSLLCEFIKHIRPTLALAEYKHLLDTDPSTVALMTSHLLYWRKALLVDLVSLGHSYQLCPPALPLAALNDDFAAAFPGLPHIVALLSLVSRRPRQPFERVMHALDPRLGGRDNEQTMAVLVWLLKRGLVRRERTHLRLKINAHTKRAVRMRMQCASDEPGSRPPPLPVRVPLPSSPFGPGPASSPLITTTNATPELHGQSATTSQSSLLRLAGGVTAVKRTPFEMGCGQLAFGGTSWGESVSLDSLVGSVEGVSRRRKPRVRLTGGEIDCEGDDPKGRQAHQQGEDSVEEQIIGNPGKMSEIERMWVEEILLGKSEAQKRMFQATCKYFTGTHPVESILSQSGLGNCSESGVMGSFEENCLVVFKDSLVVLVFP